MASDQRAMIAAPGWGRRGSSSPFLKKLTMPAVGAAAGQRVIQNLAEAYNAMSDLASHVESTAWPA